MPFEASGRDIPLVELLGAVSLATDLGNGQPPFHAVRSAVLAVALGRELGVTRQELAAVQQVTLLRFLGCTADAAETAGMAGGDDIGFRAAMAPVVMGPRAEMGRRLTAAVGVGGSPLRRAALIAGALADPGGARRAMTAHCEVAAMFAMRLGCTDEVREGLAHAYERWDGAGFPDGLAGEAVPLAVRIAVVAADADLWWRTGPGELAAVFRARAGHAYDPGVIDACLRLAVPVLGVMDTGPAWEALLAVADSEPVPDLDRVLTAVADFTDLKSPWTRGHSPRVADLVAGAATELGLAPEEVQTARWAALVHDLGRVGVPNGIWDRPGPLGVAERERVRLHPHLTESTLACCTPLARLGRLGGAHHERLDGSGYHRGSRDQTTTERILAVADAVAAMGAARPYRPPRQAGQIADVVRAEVREGRLDRSAAAAVLAAAGTGRRVPRATWPGGLSDREVEVLRLIARGRSNGQVAADLHLSVKTVGRHVENVYAKLGMHTRAAAAVFAMQHRLLDR